MDEKPSKIEKRINLALQGGGSHGAFTWGVLDGVCIKVAQMRRGSY